MSKNKEHEKELSVASEVKTLTIPVNEKALQDMLKPAPGTEEITAEDIVMPRIRLLQDQSTEVKSKESASGKLKNSLTGETYDSIEFIPIAMHKSRIMFDIDNRNGSPLCRSNDVKIGSDGTRCPECDNAKWINNKPPLCNMIFNYLIIQPNEIGVMFIPSILSFMKTSVQSAMKLNMSVECTIPRQPFWTKVWRVTPRIKPFKKGEAYILDVQQVRDSTADERSWAELIYKHTSSKKIDLTADEIQTGDLATDDLTG